MTEPNLTRRIVCAAIRKADGQIICGARHFDQVMIQQIDARNERKEWKQAEQGFINTWCEFLTREEAWIVAELNKQIIRDPEWQTGTLHSEHLY